MPVEIRELVIQARLAEAADKSPTQAPANKVPGKATEEDSEGPCQDKMAEDIYDRCLAKLKEWLAEKSMR
jgi:hypothetical protein